MHVVNFQQLLRTIALITLAVFFSPQTLLLANDLDAIKERGVLRHIGIPYANFVTTDGYGLDVELMILFAQHLGVKYQLVYTSWEDAFGDLTGERVQASGNQFTVLGKTENRGDLLANGLTILPWREKIVSFSTPTFPTGVWLLARADSPLKPIVPSGDIEKDIIHTKKMLAGKTVLSMKGTCLDPDLYALSQAGAKIILHTESQNLNDIAPAILDGKADTALLDIPDALVALHKWPGEIKVLGPISRPQLMAVAFPKSSPQLKKAFNEFFAICWQDGTYVRLVRKYYPSVFLYMGDFFGLEKNDL